MTFFLYLCSCMQIRTLSNYLHIQWKDRKFSKELNYIEVQWKMNLNLCESSVKTGPVLKTYSSLKDSTWHKGRCLDISHISGYPYFNRSHVQLLNLYINWHKLAENSQSEGKGRGHNLGRHCASPVPPLSRCRVT